MDETRLSQLLLAARRMLEGGELAAGSMKPGARPKGSRRRIPQNDTEKKPVFSVSLFVFPRSFILP